MSPSSHQRNIKIDLAKWVSGNERESELEENGSTPRKYAISALKGSGCTIEYVSQFVGCTGSISGKT
jgi:hypothetical protein